MTDIDEAAVDRFAVAVSAAFRRSTAPRPRAVAAPRPPGGRAARMQAEARPGRSCALIFTERDGTESEVILDAATCRDVAAALTRAAR